MSPEPAVTPVFVDPSGRRARWVRAAFGAVGALASLYVATVALSLVLPAGALHLSVPGLGAVLAGPAPAHGGPRNGGSDGLAVPAPSPATSNTTSTDPDPAQRAGSVNQPAGGAPDAATSTNLVTPAAGSTSPIGTRPSSTAAPSATRGRSTPRPTGGPPTAGHPTPRPSKGSPSPRPSNGHGNGVSPSPGKSPRPHPTPSHT